MSKEESIVIDSVEINFADVNYLVGKLLTYVDATYQDKEQREAHKQIVKNICYFWTDELYAKQIPEKYHLTTR